MVVVWAAFLARKLLRPGAQPQDTPQPQPQPQGRGQSNGLGCSSGMLLLLGHPSWQWSQPPDADVAVLSAAGALGRLHGRPF